VLRSSLVFQGSRLAGLLLVGLGLVPGCRGGSTRAEAHARPGAEPAAAAPREVQLERAALTNLESVLEVSGTLAAHERVTLATRVAGRLASIDVDLASPVKQGQPLAQIETTDYQLGVARAEALVAQMKAQLGLAPSADVSALEADATTGVRHARASFEEEQANVKRLSALVSSGLAPEAELDTARASLARAEDALESARDEVGLRRAQLRERQSELEIARERLRDSTIRSPLDGFVQARMADPGEYLAAGAPVVEVVDIDPLRLRLSLPERDASQVRTGQVVKLLAEPGAPAGHQGVVARLAPSLDPASRTLLVEADIPNPGGLRPGNFVRAHIEVGSRQALTLPADTVVTFAGLQKVITVHEGHAVERPVTTGITQAGRIEITSGLSPGDAVVLAPAGLQQGQPVRVNGP
jgi:RND family efflux transporter MFP subunit